MERRPALVVAAVDVGAVLDEKLDHLEVVVDAGLESNNDHESTLINFL